MKAICVALAAAAIGGLSTYAVIETAGLLGTLGSHATMRISTLVGALSGASAGSALLAMILRGIVVREDRRAIASLERRFAELEARTRSQVESREDATVRA